MKITIEAESDKEITDLRHGGVANPQIIEGVIDFALVGIYTANGEVGPVRRLHGHGVGLIGHLHSGIAQVQQDMLREHVKCEP